MRCFFFLCSIFILLEFISPSQSCRCLNNPDDQEKFCASTFVGVIKLLDPVGEDGSKRIFSAEAIEVYKNTTNTPVSSTQLSVAIGRTSCDVRMRAQTTYLIASSASNNRLYPFLCGGFRRIWSSVDENQRENFRSVYQKKCQCSRRVSNPAGYTTCM